LTQSAIENSRSTTCRATCYAPALALALALAAVTITPTAEAEPTDADRTAAEALFRENKRLMDEGNYGEACPRLAESQQRDPGGGTLLTLALCHEQQGKLATAWAQFREALGMAREAQRQERITMAEEHIAALEPRLPKLTVVVPSAATVEGLEVSLDGSSAVLGTPLPIDPGEHELNATAPGRKPWSETFSIDESEARTLKVTVLDDAPQAPPPPPVPEPVPVPPAKEDARGGGTQQVIGFIAGGLGLAAIGAGAVAGGIAISKRGDSDDQCPEERCTQLGVDLNEDAKTAALVSNIGVFGGLGLLAVGTVLVLTAGSSDDEPSTEAARLGPTWQLNPMVGPAGGGLLLRRSF